jgi:hypothetical protein
VFVATTFTLDASIDNLRSMFTPTNTKFYNDVIFIKGQQQMIVKTWEAYQPQEAKDSASPYIKMKKEDPPFSIKTLRLYDTNNDMITEIITEQIIGDFPSNFFYDTSTLFYNNSIYYFKRHCVESLCSVNKHLAKKKTNVGQNETSDGTKENPSYHIYL